MKPKGNLLIIGGAEDIGGEIPQDEGGENFERFEILRELTKASKNKKIEIITTGSRFPAEVKKRYLKAFCALGYNNAEFIPIQDKLEARKKSYLRRVLNAGVLFFSGGDQFRLAAILGGTKFIEAIRERYYHDEDFLVAGTSAGAMVMSDVMIIEGGSKEALMEDDLKTSSGLSFLHHCIIDTHFIKRGRFARLAHAVVLNPDQLGIGLGEDTALIIKKGENAECRGSGMVVIIDGRYIKQTNISNVTKEEAIFVENLKVHVLAKNCRFSLRTRHLANPAINPQLSTRQRELG